MIKRKIFRAYIPSAVMTNSCGNFSAPPFSLAQFARLSPLTLCMNGVGGYVMPTFHSLRQGVRRHISFHESAATTIHC